MESFIEPGKFIEVGSDEWKAYLIHRIKSIEKDIREGEEQLSILRNVVLKLHASLSTGKL